MAVEETSRSGNVWDNVDMESFFSAFKAERLGTKAYCMRAQAKSDMFDYIECFHDLTRRPSTLGCGSPLDPENSQSL